MKHLFINFLFITAFLSISFSASADELGALKIFKTHSGNPKVEMTLVRLGELKERKVLAYFKTPDFAINGEYNIYKGECQTTRCNTVIYKVIGGSIRNFVSQNGYFGDYFELLLPGRSKPLAVYYDEKLSRKISNKAVYNEYLISVGRNKKGNYNADEITKSFNDELKNLQKACKSSVEINKNIDSFRKSKLIHLIGMGKYYMKEIASKCADSDYREELTKIKIINFLPDISHKSIQLKKSELFIYLSESTYNPKYETKLWLENL